MASVLGMRVAGGLNDLPAREIISGIDPRDIIVGVENAWADTPGGSDQERYNRMAQPWAGAAYTLVGGDWVKVGGRPNAVDGDQLERQFPNLAAVWQSFARAQGNRQSSPGSLPQLRADLIEVARQIDSPGRIDPGAGEGQSLRALKARRSAG